MAKKITISFLSNPINPQLLMYNIEISGVSIPYDTGTGALSLLFSGNPSDANNVNIKQTLQGTISETFLVLQTYYSYQIIDYKIVGDTIEVSVDSENVTVTGVNKPPSIDLLVSDIAVNTTPALLYFMEYTDPMNVGYRVDIFKRGGTETAQLIYGYATMQGGSVKDNLDPIRGSGLTLNLESTIDVNLEDLYTDDENEFSVKFYRNSQLMFNGFIKPDGVFQSFVNDRWVINLECVDGLGILKDLAFVKPSGLQFVGKQSALEIIYNCLFRTGLSMNLNTSVNIYYEGLVPTTALDPLAQINISVNRFVKKDNSTIMDCQAVLKSVLTLFKASITQLNGEWYVYKSNELSENAIVQFRQYSKVDNSYLGINARNLNVNIGSQINGKYPHHCNSNQQIEIKGGVAAFRINYKYGFVVPNLPNYDLSHVGINYPNWTVLNANQIVIDPLKSKGVLIKPSGTTLDVIKSDNVFFESFSKVDFRFKFSVDLPVLGTALWLRYSVVLSAVGVADKVLKFDSSLGLAPIWVDRFPLDNNNDVIIKGVERGVSSYDLNNVVIPYDSNISVIIKRPYKAISAFITVDFISVDIGRSIPLEQGEFHTVSRQKRPSSIAKETEEIFNGDSPSIIYEGAIFKTDKITQTSKWFRKGKIESKPILQISGEEVLRISQKPARVFSGDVFGFIPAFSVVTIDSFNMKFMAIEHAFDSKSNITKCKFLQIMHEELIDINYKLTYDYGNVTKATIVS